MSPAKTSRKRVLILGGPQDEHAQYVYEQLARRDAAPLYFDVKHFPKDIQITHDPERNSGVITFGGDAVVRFEDIRSIYWRNYNRTPNRFKNPIPDYDMAYIAENDSRSLSESLLMGLDTRWVNGWKAYELHQRKPYALSLVARLGVRIPRTICSNDPQHLREFFVREKNVIFKPIQGGTHTEKVREEALTDANLRGLALAPLTFQEEIPGTNVRVFVAGERVHGVEVRTEAVDFRDDPRPGLIEIDVPDAIAAQSLEIARTLGLLWTGIDYRVTPDGEYVYLEANPSPMFMGFEQVAGVPLTDALLTLLTA